MAGVQGKDQSAPARPGRFEVMGGHFMSAFAIGQKVKVLCLPAKVLSITFTADRVFYDVEFEAGGAKARHESSEVSE